MITNDLCVYCEEVKPVTLHDGEMVCYDCRIEFIDQEFKDEAESKLTFQDICDNLGVPNFTEIF